MRTLFKCILAALAFFFTAWGWIAPAVAQGYPARPITLYVAFTPGGPSDVLARVVGKRMGDVLGQTVVIENKPGAGGNIAAEYVAHAAPDGYTLLVGNNSILATNAALYSNIRFDAIRDFAPIGLIGTQPNILVVNPKKLDVKSLDELIARAKAEPGKYTFASSGVGAAAHLSGELFKQMAGVDLVHVPYKGAAPALQDLLAGQVDLMFATSASVTGFIESGSLRAIGVTTPKRISAFPDLPTMDELGLKGFDATTWHGLVAPAGTPPAIIAKLHDAVVDSLNDPQVRAQLAKLGVEIVGDKPEEFARYIASETPKWTAIVKAAGLKAQ